MNAPVNRKWTPRSQPPTDLGNVMIRMGVITDVQLSQAVAKHRAEPGTKLGEAALALGFICKEDLELALQYQERMRDGGAVTVMIDMVSRHTKRLMPQTA